MREAGTRLAITLFQIYLLSGRLDHVHGVCMAVPLRVRDEMSGRETRWLVVFCLFNEY